MPRLNCESPSACIDSSIVTNKATSLPSGKNKISAKKFPIAKNVQSSVSSLQHTSKLSRDKIDNQNALINQLVQVINIRK